jgi:hypothetical protein
MYGHVWLEHGHKYEPSTGEFKRGHGLRKIRYDNTDSVHNGKIIETGYWLSAEQCMSIVRQLAKTNRVPKILQSRIYSALRARLSKTQYRVEQDAIFIETLKECAPWIGPEAAFALTRAT